MTYSVIFSRSARDQLDAIHDHIAEAASPEIAQRFTDAIVDHVGKLSDFPRRGTPRDDLAPGLRTIGFVDGWRSPWAWRWHGAGGAHLLWWTGF